MNSFRSLRQGAAASALLLLLSACGSFSDVVSDRQMEYKHSQTAPSLEIPPDLTASTMDDSMKVPEMSPGGSATYSAYSGERREGEASRNDAVLPAARGVRMERAGDKRWLVVQNDPAAVWPKVREFFVGAGWLIKREDPRVGILETDWAENRADIPQDGIRALLGKALDMLYSAATRDKFRVRLERGAEAGTTEVYVSHIGAEEVVQGDSTVWQARPNDPGLEAEMLRRLMVSFGVDEKKSRTLVTEAQPQPSRAHLSRDGDGAAIVMEEDFPSAWRRAGMALDRVGFTVEDRDRSRGIYYVRYNDPLKEEEKKKDGWLSKLAFWSSDKGALEQRYQVSLSGEGPATRLTILSQDGQRDRSETATRILELLLNQLK